MKVKTTILSKLEKVLVELDEEMRKSLASSGKKRINIFELSDRWETLDQKFAEYMLKLEESKLSHEQESKKFNIQACYNIMISLYTIPTSKLARSAGVGKKPAYSEKPRRAALSDEEAADRYARKVEELS